MSDPEYTEGLIARYKALQHSGGDGMSDEDALELFTISIILGKRDFTLNEDEVDWLPPFTPDAE